MRLNRFFGDFDFNQRILEIVDRDLFHQAKNVLRLKAGEEIILANIDGQEATARIVDYGKDLVSVDIQEVRANQNEPACQVTLYCSILKRENFELVVQKAVEVGVSEIQPIICERTVKTGLRSDRLRKIIKEASEQSGRGIVPILREAIDFKDAIAGAPENSSNILLDSSGDKLLTPEIDSLSRQKSTGIFIGPEGGWSSFEIDLARQRGFAVLSLGRLTLRAETAAIVAAYLACNNQ